MRRPAVLPLLAAAVLIPSALTAPTAGAMPSSAVLDAPTPDEPGRKRLAGTDRYETAAAVGRDSWPTGPVPAVFVVTGQAYADALAAGPAAHHIGGPVLPVTREVIPDPIRGELERLAPERVVVLGGPDAVSDAVATELQGFTTGAVTRVAGENRYGTAALLATELFTAPVRQVLVATGAGFADALAGGAAGATQDSPLLLVEPTRLPTETAEALRALQPGGIAVLGGPSAVPDAVLTQLEDHTTGSVTRLSGGNRYATAAAVVQRFWPQTAPVAYLATGRDFPDALAGAPAAGRDSAPLLLVEPGCMPDETRRQLDRLQPTTTVVLGGPSTVSDAAAGGTPCPPPPPPCADVFPAAFADTLARDFPDQRVTASVYDTRTRCWYSLHRGLRITTASVIKAGVLGAVLLRAQDAGRPLTDWERARIAPMIELSHNNPYVSDLYAHVGGVEGMDAADRRWGATATTNTSAYGATWTTTEDRTRVSLKMLHGLGPLAPEHRAEAWRYMSAVHPTQRWGISAGLPSGWSVALKNGFYPMRGYGWRAGSTGFADSGTVGGYAVSILTDGGGSQWQGMRLVETVSRRVAALLAGGSPAPRPFDRAHCTDTSGGESWSTVAQRLGSDAAGVQRVSGGNPSPLQGQRACSPTLRP